MTNEELAEKIAALTRTELYYSDPNIPYDYSLWQSFEEAMTIIRHLQSDNAALREGLLEATQYFETHAMPISAKRFRRILTATDPNRGK